MSSTSKRIMILEEIIRRDEVILLRLQKRILIIRESMQHICAIDQCNHEQSIPRVNIDLTGTRLLDAVRILLRESPGKWIVDIDIANRIIMRGYRTISARNPENDPRKIARSVGILLRRRSDEFERRGKQFRVSGPNSTRTT